MPNKLHFYTKYSKEKIKISDKPLASGGEGAIYAIASPRSYKHLVVKIFYPDKRTAEREQKMLYLRKYPPMSFEKGQHPSIGWIQDLVYRENRFLGILLLRIEGKKLTKLTLSKLPRRADKAWQRFAFQSPDALKLRLRTCFNLAVVIYQIHESGQYVLVDLKPDNILMQPNGLLAIVDMDSVEVIQDGKALFAAPVATPEYTPPEHYKGPRTVIEETWDRFSLGVIFYQLLLGLHPFAASCHPPYDNLVSIHDKIEHDLYVHHSDKQAFFRVIPPPHQSYQKLPVEIQGLFYNCFENGAQDPLLRPSALEWCSTLAKLLELPFNIPSNNFPKIDHPLSKLFFTPEAISTKIELNLHHPSSYFSIPTFQAKDFSGATKLPKKNDLVELRTSIEKVYKDHLDVQRKGWFLGSILLLSVFILIYMLPVLIILGLGGIFIIILNFFYTEKETIFKETRQLMHSMTNSVDEKNDLLQVNKKQKKTRLALITQYQQLNTEFQSQVEHIKATNNLLKVVKIGLKKQAEIKPNISRVDNRIRYDLTPVLKETRTREINTQKQLYKEFSKKFHETNAQIKKWTKDHLREKALKKHKIDLIEEKLKKIFDPTKKALNEEYEVYTKQVNQDLLKQLNTEIDTLTRTSNQKLDQIEKALSYIKSTEHLYNKTASAATPYAITNHRINEIVNSRPETLEIVNQRFGSNRSSCRNYLKLILNNLPGFQPNTALDELKTTYEFLQKEIDQLTIGNDKKQRLVEFFEINLTPLKLDKVGTHNSSFQKLGKHKNKISQHYLEIKKNLELLETSIIELVHTPSLAEDALFMESWNKKVETQKEIIQHNISNYIRLQTFFYTEKLMFNLYQATQVYALKEGYIFNLGKEHQEEVLQEIDKKQQKRIKEKVALLEQKKALKLALKEATMNAQQTWLEKKQTLLDDINQKHQSTLQIKEQKFTQEKEILLKQHREEKKDLKNLEENYITVLNFLEKSQESIQEEYKQALEDNQLECEAVYIDCKEEYYKELYAIEEKLKHYKNSYQNTVHHIEKHKKEAPQSRIYADALPSQIRTLTEIEEKIATLQQKINHNEFKRIKIDALDQWEENYQNKIYIKDLLLGQTEQVKQLKIKEKEKK